MTIIEKLGLAIWATLSLAASPISAASTPSWEASPQDESLRSDPSPETLPVVVGYTWEPAAADGSCSYWASGSQEEGYVTTTHEFGQGIITVADVVEPPELYPQTYQWPYVIDDTDTITVRRPSLDVTTWDVTPQSDGSVILSTEEHPQEQCRMQRVSEAN